MISSILRAGSRRLRWQILTLPFVLIFSHAVILNYAARADDPNELWQTAREVLDRYCVECHEGQAAEAEVDLRWLQSSVVDSSNIEPDRDTIQKWLRVREMLASAQMPPPDSAQPSERELQELSAWLKLYLRLIAEHQAGDPGPVLLRRLTNSEYNYTIRDWTGIDSLDPTREFPVDGAAGEGFTNVGSGQGMSPAMVQKYLDAAKEVAAHLVLLPDGIGFSEFLSRRDRTDELIQRIQAFYNRYSSEGGGTEVDLQGIRFATNEGGVLPLRNYLETILSGGDPMQAHQQESAVGALLSSRYLHSLRTVLENAPANGPHNPWFQALRKRWQTLASDPDHAAVHLNALISEIETAQNKLWRFNTIGLLEGDGTPPRWAVPISTLVTEQDVRIEIAAANDQDDDDKAKPIDVMWSARGLGETAAKVRLREARLEFPVDAVGQAVPSIPLPQVEAVAERMNELRSAELARSATYLNAIALNRRDGTSLDELATKSNLSLDVLERWAQWLGENQHLRTIRGHFQNRLSAIGGHQALSGLGTNDPPGILVNQSDEAIQHSTLLVPARGVTVHPSPSHDAFIVWQSPADSSVVVQGSIADTDPNCGNGVTAKLVKVSRSGNRVLWIADINNASGGQLQLESPLQVRKGDHLWLIVGARDRDHACDTTHIQFVVTEAADGPLEAQRTWDVSRDIVANIHRGNPMADSYGNSAVWHLGALEAEAPNHWSIPADSRLSQWKEALDSNATAEELRTKALDIQQLLASQAEASSFSSGDGPLAALANDKVGPLAWLTIAQQQVIADGNARRSDEWVIDVPSDNRELVHVRLPKELALGSTLECTAEIVSPKGAVQLVLPPAELESAPFSLSQPVLVGGQGETRDLWEGLLAQFRDLFPPILCYHRIVPVDEVVTLVLFHREDDLLKRLMLDEGETRELDRLWDQLLFVSEEPLQLAVSYEQIYQFATQDRPDLVNAFGPMAPKIERYANDYRLRCEQVEPLQLSALIDVASHAWRRPLSQSQRDQLTAFYQRIRNDLNSHEEAMSWTLVFILTSPQFLYKLEQPVEGALPGRVDDFELASRLSYFLSSSAPDPHLLKLAEKGSLQHPEKLKQEVERLLKNPKIRRMAIEFGCQWLHVRDFDRNEDKNENLFPEFAELRGDMYEETVRFFTDLLQNNGSILDILEANYTFLNARLAAHYDIPWPSDWPNDIEDWRRVEGVRDTHRGGVLSMATVLASQSGASRTSPILRGNWVYETLLGQRLPNPPPGVPVLPETLPEGLSERELIERHSSEPSCARCHIKIDPFGFALEQFDPLGRFRSETPDVKAKLQSGREIEGLAGLQSYLLEARREDFVRQWCRKLFGYALGRELQLADEPLLDKLMEHVALNDYRVWSAVHWITQSLPFQQIRGNETDIHP